MTLDTRRKAPSSSTPTNPASQGSGARRGGPSIRSLSSGSITPMEDEEGDLSSSIPVGIKLKNPVDKPKRSTRGRNPLPPTKGPLFPPLPPKPTRPQVSPKPSQDSKGSKVPIQDEEEEEMIAGPSRSPARDVKENRPSTPEAIITIPALGSGTSLTPPPPSSDNVEVVIVSENSGEGSRKGRRAVDIKVELEDGNAIQGEEEDTPKQTRTTRGRLAPPGSRGTTPTGSAGSEKSGPRTSLGRRRRGEEQLLLDDHLLPEEIRRTSSSGKKKGGMDLVEKQEEMDEGENGHEEVEEEVQGDEPEVDAEEEQQEENPVDDIIEQSIIDPDEEAVDDEEGDEVTRCVCQLDGEHLEIYTLM